MGKAISMTTEIAVNQESMALAVAGFKQLSEEFRGDYETLAAANDVLCGAWGGEGSEIVAELRILVNGYLDVLATITEAESENLASTALTFQDQDQELASGLQQTP
jgi:uncharacterized protein YukE